MVGLSVPFFFVVMFKISSWGVGACFSSPSHEPIVSGQASRTLDRMQSRCQSRGTQRFSDIHVARNGAFLLLTRGFWHDGSWRSLPLRAGGFPALRRGL